MLSLVCLQDRQEDGQNRTGEIWWRIKKEIWTGNIVWEVINIPILLEAMELKMHRQDRMCRVKKGGAQDGTLENTNIKGAYRKLTGKTEGTREMDGELKECTITKALRKKHFKKRRVTGSNSKSLHNKNMKTVKAEQHI